MSSKQANSLTNSTLFTLVVYLYVRVIWKILVRKKMRLQNLIWLPLFGISVITQASDLPLRECDTIEADRTTEAKPFSIASQLADTSWYVESMDALLSFGKEDRYGGLKLHHKKNGVTLNGSYRICCNRHIVAEIGSHRGDSFDFILNNVSFSADTLTAWKTDGTLILASRQL